jgi:hypothetical protein
MAEMQLVKLKRYGMTLRERNTNLGFESMSEVLDSCKEVAEKSRLVQIRSDAICRFSVHFIENALAVPAWDRYCHFFEGGEQTVTYLLVLDSLNFCFWPLPGEKRWEIEFGPQTLSGYYALAVALKKAMASEFPITDPAFLSRLSLNDMNRMLGGRGNLQLIEERQKILHEVGHVLLHEYKGKAAKLVESARHSARELTLLLADKFRSFRDVALYEGIQVAFYKRAQILVSDLYGAFQGEDWGHFFDMGHLTTFADYKLPQVLRHLGIISYAEELQKRVDQRLTIEAGSREEIEIRANTVLAVELIRQELERLGKTLRSFEIDWVLWSLGQRPEYKQTPYHRTVTIYY